MSKYNLSIENVNSGNTITVGVLASKGPKGDQGDSWTGGEYNKTTGVVTFTSDDGIGFSTDDLRGKFTGVTLSTTVSEGDAVTAEGNLVTESTVNEFLGFASEDGVSSDVINVQRRGKFTLGTWTWTPGATLYFTNSGGLTETHPVDTYRKAGVALSATEINIDPGPIVAETTGYSNTVIVTDDGGYLPDELINVTSLTVDTGGSGSEDSLIRTDSSGYVDFTFFDLDNNSVNTGGSGSEDTLIRTDSNGLLDSSFRSYSVDTSQSGSSVDIDFDYDFVDIDLSVVSTTFSFVNEDTVDRVTVLIRYDADSYDVSGSTDTGNTATSSAAFTAGILIGDSGTKTYGLNGSGLLYEATLTTAYDISTFSSESQVLDVSSQATNSNNFDISSNGEYLYHLDGANREVTRWDLSTPWDASTASYSQFGSGFSFSDLGEAIKISDDGTKFFYLTVSGIVEEYNLTTAYDITTAVDANSDFDASSQANDPDDFVFSPDGTKMYIYDIPDLYQYDLSNAWDVSTASYIGSLDINNLFSGSNYDFISVPKDNPEKLYVYDQNAAREFAEGNFGNPSLSITWPASLKGSGDLTPPTNKKENVYQIVTTDGGTTHFVTSAVEEQD